ncbi:RagB/SusD family nutrient uptake outer membrane protein [Dysgonomonas sp. Marseille-P4677]|uniref:RagB/SusD family nutrient uptake outer membrane protein n=1 Tax=Dysgonomonas sp. Marseille-P4677 TaxID=2364790 RepID=UPI001912C9EE|nr:RagB/SusD family nutrient uptake outer membrane protein [Dysgonomonas sp. Marseille-P4677]MBK5720290.1 RagB/SusD family nutrient uptake outer membrane protein [Dysgonomonas sp. Marseille-P4677]
MKIKNIYIILIAGLLCPFFSSCLSDLDSMPLNKHILTSDNVYVSAEAYKGVLAKCYGSLINNAQKGSDSDGDLNGMDTGYSGYTRAVFYLQDCTTDGIALHSGSSQGSRDLLFMNWNPSTQIIRYSYYRLYMSISYCNEFLRESTDEKLKERGLYDEMKNEIPYYRAEVRFIRAYCYTMLCDLFGSGPFIDESMSLGTIPSQKSRQEIYNYAASETEAVAEQLKAPGANEYARVDQVAAWFLLSRLYLNAQTWGDKNEYQKAYTNAKKVIESGKYPLAADYRHLFLADNHTCREIIWAMPQDEVNTPNSAGTNFMIKALSDGKMSSFTGMTDSWGNARVKTQLVNKFEDADQIFDQNDPWGDSKKDKRAQFYTIGHTKITWVVGKAFQNDFNNGYACLKWRNMTKDRKPLAEKGTKYVSIDFPMFRTADAYLMAAEAILRGGGGTRAEALDYINEVRDRAYMSGKYGSGISGRISDNQLTLDFILDERARELHTELVRRTDLIRFGKFTKGNNWDWKGSDGSADNYIGKDVSDKFKLFPIPQEEFTVNPNLTQNPDFQ